MDRRTWERIESDFRAWSFHVYYRKTYADEPDPAFRFVKDLVASTRAIRDREAVIQWYQERKVDADVETIPT